MKTSCYTDSQIMAILKQADAGTPVPQLCREHGMLSAISPRAELRFMLHEGSVDAGVFLDFLKRLIVGAQAPVFLIVDGRSIHKAAKVKQFVQEQNGMLKLFYLPPYSPQLNPDEVVWAHVKREVSRKLVQSKDEMKQLMFGSLRRIEAAGAAQVVLPSVRVLVYPYLTLLPRKLVLSCV